MNTNNLYRRYQELQQYVGWTDADAQRVQSVASLIEPHLPALIDDFYNEIERHPDARKVITGGAQQIERLKGTLGAWLRELLFGPYDADYVARRWRVGWRHVEIGLDQVYTNVALSRLRRGLLRTVQQFWQGKHQDLLAIRLSLNALLDLDLAIIEDAYQTEYVDRQQRAERQRSEAAFRALVQAAPCMIVILSRDHRILYFNRFAEEVTGYSTETVLGKDYFTTFLPDEYRCAVAEDIQRVSSGGATRGFEYPVLREDGTRRSMIWNAERLGEYEGVPAVLVVGQDITSLKRAQDQALQSERLAAIGQMMTGLAHESGNALARSQSCLEMLQWEVEDRPEALELIKSIQKAQDHLQQLYEEVRGYAAPIKLEREVWDLHAIWRQAWANLALMRQGRETVLREETAGLDLHCAVDQYRLEQVFRNILENALAACPGAVDIVFDCSEASLNGYQALRIAVRDNGPGLSPEQKQRIFEPFFTTKTKGTGLGMAIAKRIIDAHGGQIAVGPGSVGGAEIIITLPRGNL
jgi:PAS domain S-box-containing protein